MWFPELREDGEPDRVSHYARSHVAVADHTACLRFPVLNVNLMNIAHLMCLCAGFLLCGHERCCSTIYLMI